MRLLALSVVFLRCGSGCMSTRLRQRVTDQARTIPDVYHQVVLDNLAMTHSCPNRVPYFSDPQTARVEIVRTRSASYGAIFDSLVAAPEAVL
jgi:hypothetical protein